MYAQYGMRTRSMWDFAMLHAKNKGKNKIKTKSMVRSWLKKIIIMNFYCPPECWTVVNNMGFYVTACLLPLSSLAGLSCTLFCKARSKDLVVVYLPSISLPDFHFCCCKLGMDNKYNCSCLQTFSFRPSYFLKTILTRFVSDF